MKNLTAFTLLLLSSCLLAQTPADKLIAEGQQSPTLEKNLHVLTDEIGGRVPGTPAMDRAVQWGVDAFKAAGGENVHTSPRSLPHHGAKAIPRWKLSVRCAFVCALSP